MPSNFAMHATTTTSEGFVNLTHTPTSTPTVAMISLAEAEQAERCYFRYGAISIACCDVCNVRFPAYDQRDIERDRAVTWCFNCGSREGYRELTRDEWARNRLCPADKRELTNTPAHDALSCAGSAGQESQGPATALSAVG